MTISQIQAAEFPLQGGQALSPLFKGACLDGSWAPPWGGGGVQGMYHQEEILLKAQIVPE